MGAKKKRAGNKEPAPAAADDWKAKLKKWAPVVGSVLVGLVFVVAGVLKVYDPFSFYTQIRGYGLVDHSVAKAAAFALPPIEIGLGLAAMLGFYRRWTCMATAGLMVLFLIAVGHAWATGSTDNCGCFGELLARSPKATFFEDLGLLILSLIGTVGDGHLSRVGEREVKPWYKAVLVGAFVVSGAILSVVMGAFGIRAGGKLKPGLVVSEWKLTELEADGYKKKGVKLNLLKGVHLLVFYSPMCKHCWMSIERVQKLSKVKGLAGVAGVSHDRHPEKLFRFFAQGMAKKGADYPLFTMKWKDYRQLNRSVPKTVVIKTGVVRFVLKGVPSPKAVREYLK